MTAAKKSLVDLLVLMFALMPSILGPIQLRLLECLHIRPFWMRGRQSWLGLSQT